jgi:hypothetical protein
MDRKLVSRDMPDTFRLRLRIGGEGKGERKGEGEGKGHHHLHTLKQTFSQNAALSSYLARSRGPDEKDRNAERIVE